MTASRVVGGRRGGRGRVRDDPNKNCGKLKQPSAKLLRLITAYFYVPLCRVENVAPSPPKKPTELLFGGAGMDEDEDEDQDQDEQQEKAEDGRRCIDRAALAYYGPLPCRRQRRDAWEAGAAAVPAAHHCPGHGVRRGMPGLGRDVLRWLVALNLSFPIKNIKRDFSNGFMVAEIFSRYFPMDIHMHSFDYGSRAASKRDNWEQLTKIFRRKGFVVQGHETENIIQCRSEDGAGPLLARMYTFLTQKRCKPGEGEAEQLFIQQHDSPKHWDTQAPLEASLGNVKEDREQYAFSDSVLSSHNHGDYEEESCDSRHRYATSTSVEDMYHGDIQLDPRYERDMLLKMDDEVYGFDLPASSENALRFPHEEERIQRNGGLVQPTRNKGCNAVEIARQREVKKAVGLAKGGVRAEELRYAELAHKARVEAGLAFRSPNRKRNFKQYTLPDYRRQKQFGYVELGRLGPGDPTPELIVKPFLLGDRAGFARLVRSLTLSLKVDDKKGRRADQMHMLSNRDKLAQRKEFGHHARSCNIMSHANPTLVDYSRTVKVDTASARKKTDKKYLLIENDKGKVFAEQALAFASKIPKPKVKIPTKDAQENVLPIQNPHAMSDLQILEAKHQSDKQHIESIRRDLEHFLR